MDRYGGFNYNYIVWDRILQLLGVGKHYVPEWRIGRIYIQSNVRFDQSTRYSLTDGWRQNFTINTFWCLKKKTEKFLTFSPILCIHDDDLENGEKIVGVHCNYRFADENPSRNPIGKKININPQIPEGFGLYEERNYYYKRGDDETDRAFKSRTKNNFFRKKKKAMFKIWSIYWSDIECGCTFKIKIKIKSKN